VVSNVGFESSLCVAFVGQLMYASSQTETKTQTKMYSVIAAFSLCAFSLKMSEMYFVIAAFSLKMYVCKFRLRVLQFDTCISARQKHCWDN